MCGGDDSAAYNSSPRSSRRYTEYGILVERDSAGSARSPVCVGGVAFVSGQASRIKKNAGIHSPEDPRDDPPGFQSGALAPHRAKASAGTSGNFGSYLFCQELILKRLNSEVSNPTTHPLQKRSQKESEQRRSASAQMEVSPSSQPPTAAMRRSNGGKRRGTEGGDGGRDGGEEQESGEKMPMVTRAFLTAISGERYNST
ncbi:hypothetical protein K438DRAFT_1774472 [Mycena galopus ATCC 62051]|nr:hypothetical protein K438DRAFT_1774472 [Mycena galopus ATCC 62051]